MNMDYDAIVIGAGLGGVSCASLLAKNGLKTLVLEQSDIIGGCCSTFEHEGYKFDTGASIVMVSDPLEKFFELAGKPREDYIELIPCDPIYSFITADGRRFTVPTDIDETSDIIAAIAPEDVAGWKSFCALGKGMFETMSDMMTTPMNTMAEALAMQLKFPNMYRYMPYFLRSHLGVTRSFFKHPTIQATVAFQSYYAGAPPELGMGMMGFIALMEHLGITYPRGGMIAIPEGMARLGQEFGMELRTKSKVDKILLEDKNVRGVRLADGTEITSKIVVSNLNAKVTYFKLIGAENLSSWANKAIDSYALAMPCPMVYVGLDTRPELEAHHTMQTPSVQVANDAWNYCYSKGTIPEESGCLVSWTTESDPELAPEGHHALNVVYGGPVPYAPLGDNWDLLKDDIREGVIKKMEEVIQPDIADHIDELFISTPLDFERRLLNPHGAIYGLFLDITTSAMFRPNPRSRAIKNLYLAGASTGMGGGVPTTIASGVITSNYIVQDHG
jgi:phytoene desaturase